MANEMNMQTKRDTCVPPGTGSLLVPEFQWLFQVEMREVQDQVVGMCLLFPEKLQVARTSGKKRKTRGDHRSPSRDSAHFLHPDQRRTQVLQIARHNISICHIFGLPNVDCFLIQGLFLVKVDGVRSMIRTFNPWSFWIGENTA